MKKTIIILVSLLFFLSTSSADEPKYTNNSFARLSFITGETYIQRAADLGYEEGQVNMPITEGDRMGTTEGRAEIYLGKGNYVRLDNNTKIDFLNLPKRGYSTIRIRLWTGNAYFRVNSLKEEKNIEIHTSDVSIYVLDEGLYRIDVREDNETEIFVYSGMLEASGETDSVLIKEEQRVEISGGQFTSRPTSFIAVAEDSFDTWSDKRDSQIRKRMAKRHLPDELEDFEYELAAHGDWIYAPPYGYVWVPRGLTSGWRPYYHGRWVWLPLCGWTWLPYEPWGWVAFHFGRWHWSMGLGWYWIPTNVWGPAWVHWYWGYDYFGWAPLSYYNRPVVIINNRFYTHYSNRYYPTHSRAFTVVHKNQLRARNISKVALSQKATKSLSRIKLTKERLPYKPTRSKISVGKLKSEKIFLKKSDSQGTVKPTKGLTPRTIKRPSKGKTGKTGEATSRSTKSPSGRKIIKRKSAKKGQTEKKKSTSKLSEHMKKDSHGYSSSPKITVKNYPRKIKTKKSSSSLGKIFNRIFERSSKAIRSRSPKSSSGSSSPKKMSSRSRSSSSRPKSSGSTRSSSRSSSKVRKVKKK